MANMRMLALSAVLMGWGCTAQNPTLTGQRIKTRRSDEKARYDPTTFRDQIVTGLNEANADSEQASKFLIQSGSKLDFRQYSEVLFDVLITGGILGPGGTIVTDNNAVSSNLCVFETEADVDSMRKFTLIMERLIRQYKYLEKALDDEMTKVLMLMKGFTDIQRTRLATATYLMISSGLISPACLSQMVNEHLVKDEIALDFAHQLFATWLKEKDFASLLKILKKADIDGKLMDLFPVNNRSIEAFEKRFGDLGPIVDFQHSKYARKAAKELKAKLKKLFGENTSANEVITEIKECAEKNNLQDATITTILWGSLMKLEWSKKEDVLVDQAIAHLKKYAPVLAEFATTAETEIFLLQEMQEYCYDHTNFMKLFQKMVMLLYKMDVISEDAIITWYETGHVAKGKSVFLEQIKNMLEDMEMGKFKGDEARKFLLVQQGSELTKPENNFMAAAFNCVLVSVVVLGVGCFVVTARKAYVARSTGSFRQSKVASEEEVQLVEEAEGQ